jgi:hypothetical protein
MTRKSIVKTGWHFLILALIVIGIIVQFVRAPQTILIPLIIVGIVFYLYKRPPIWLQKMAFRGSRPSIAPPQPSKRSPNKKKKRYRFRVINGNKKSM